MIYHSKGFACVCLFYFVLRLPGIAEIKNKSQNWNSTTQRACYITFSLRVRLSGESIPPPPHVDLPVYVAGYVPYFQPNTIPIKYAAYQWCVFSAVDFLYQRFARCVHHVILPISFIHAPVIYNLSIASYQPNMLLHLFPPLSKEILMTVLRIKPRHDIQYRNILAHILTHILGCHSLLFWIDPYRNLILRILLSVNIRNFRTLHKSSNDILVFQYGWIIFNTYCFGVAVAFAYALVRWSRGGSSIAININSAASGVTNGSSHNTWHG